MNIKSFFKLKYIFFAIFATVIIGFLAKDFSFYIPILWVIIKDSSFGGPGIVCAMVVTTVFFGWPLSFLISGGSNSCERILAVNPAGLLFNFIFFLIIVRILFFAKNNAIKK